MLILDEKLPTSAFLTGVGNVVVESAGSVHRDHSSFSSLLRMLDLSLDEPGGRRCFECFKPFVSLS